MLFCCLWIFFLKLTFSKTSFRNTIRVSNSWDPDQARHFVSLIWVHTVCKGYQQTTKVATSRERVYLYAEDIYSFCFSVCPLICMYVHTYACLPFHRPASVAQLDAPSDWRLGGRGFNPCRGRQHSFVEIDHEIFSTVILSLPLIQEGQLSVSDEGMCTILVNRLED